MAGCPRRYEATTNHDAAEIVAKLHHLLHMSSNRAEARDFAGDLTEDSGTPQGGRGFRNR